MTIPIEGTSTGVVTNSEGEYEITPRGTSAVLVFSYVGYQSRSFEVTTGTGTLDVTLRQDIAELGEVVVSGLGTTVKRQNLANAVSSISASELVGKSPAQTLSSNLYGKVTGAEISANSGAPGGGISIRMRGVTSINGASQPLYIVDGIYYNNDDIPNGSSAVTAAAAGGSASNQDNPVNRIADLNPEDIESIEILKGASAAAIYGQRASGGVVIISTKRGSSGAPQFSYSQRVGITTIQKKLGMRNFTAATADSAFGSTGRTLFEEARAQNRFIDYEEELYG